MLTTFAREMDSYNSFILRFQDRAYTLAVHLLGDNPLSEAIVQDVFHESFSLWQNSSADFEPKLLRTLVKRCLRAGPVLGPPNYLKPFQALNCDEKVALILVDCLALTCPEASIILTWPFSRLLRTLACARLKIISQLNPEDRSC
jgi:hypothetical protein